MTKFGTKDNIWIVLQHWTQARELWRCGISSENIEKETKTFSTQNLWFTM